jgi:integrase
MYVFGKDFLPAEKPYNALLDKAGRLWSQYVKTDLGIDKNMYALKHTGAQLYIEKNNPDAAWLQHQMEHSSLAQTQAYIAKLQGKKIDERGLILPDY